MIITSLKRSAATLGVLAGLLAAAGPAAAQGGGADFTRFVVDGPITAKAEPRVTVDAGSGDDKVKAASGTQVGSEALALDDYGPHMARVTLGVGSSEVFELNTFGGNDTLRARGTQVGSEGVYFDLEWEAEGIITREG